MGTLIAGERFNFGESTPLNPFPDVWRQLDRAVWRWVQAHGGDALLAEVAGWASYAEGQGHSALELPQRVEAGAPGWSAEQILRLAESELVATHDDVVSGHLPPRPFVLDGDDFYLLRNYRGELAVARALAHRRAAAEAPSLPLSDAELRAVFSGSWSDAEARQRDAVNQVLGRRLMVLTGGPGTGKTTTVLRMLLALSQEYEGENQRLPRVRIAAPTGKAAQRLGEALRDGASGVWQPDSLFDGTWHAYLANVLAAESSTVHRLLGSRGRYGGFKYNREQPLLADIVVVDEASMLDLGMLRALLEALNDEAILILVGDADQLTSVGTGSVMMDIAEALESDSRGDLVRLTHCFRADVSLVPIHQAIHAGDPAAFRGAWDSAAAIGRASEEDVGNPTTLRRCLARWTQRLIHAHVNAEMTTPVSSDDQTGLAARLGVLRQQQLLCALREGPYGALSAGRVIEQRLRSRAELARWEGNPWFPGRCVMIVRNDPASGLYNGDVGICVLIQNGDEPPRLRVLFDPAAEISDEPARIRLFEPNTLPPHESAFALTVHKSQGSEYHHVGLLLPPDVQSPLLTRQTLYTGLSRAKASIELWSVPASVDKALATALRRRGQLARRILQLGEPG